MEFVHGITDGGHARPHGKREGHREMRAKVASMKKTAKQLAAGVLVASFDVIGSALPAAAQPGPGPGREFGQHVVACNDQFSGEHNPGVHHRGFSGWQMHDECD